MSRRRTAATYLGRVRHAYGEGGPGLVARKLLSRFSCDVQLHAFELDRDVPDVAADFPLDVRALSADDVDAYLALRPDEDATDVRSRLRRGDLCFGSWSGDRMVGGVWVRFDRVWVSEFGRSIPLLAGEAYGYAAFTDPERRSRGAAGVLYEATLRHLEQVGYRRVLAYVLRENAPGRMALEKVGFTPVGRIRWFHFGRFGLELSTGEGRRPRLRVHVRPGRAHE